MDFANFKPLKKLADILIERKLTVAVAESCTSGLIQNALSLAEDSMSFFQGGLTVYNTGQKVKQLNVNPIEAERCNAVSKSIAEKMARGVAKKFNSEIGVAITGYARAVPEKGITSCYAYVAFHFTEGQMVSKRIKGDPQLSQSENQSIYTKKVLEYALIELNKNPKE